MYEIRPSRLSIANCIWRAVVKKSAVYTDPANEYWGLAFTRSANGRYAAELIGPSLNPRVLEGTIGDEYWGIEFKPHVVMRGVSKPAILGSITRLPVRDGYFYLAGVAYTIPAYAELEAAVSALEKDGFITEDAAIYQSISGDADGLSLRSRQRRFRRVTGLTQKQIAQLERARHAYFLLQNSRSASEAAIEAGYADQAHMTRSLRLLRNETPAQIIAQHIERS